MLQPNTNFLELGCHVNSRFGNVEINVKSVPKSQKTIKYGTDAHDPIVPPCRGSCMRQDSSLTAHEAHIGSLALLDPDPLE